MNTDRFTWIMMYLILVNGITFFLYGLDKYKAKQHHSRISERTLLLFGYLGGAYGAYFGRKVWRHKTRKRKFRILVPLAVILWTVFLFVTLH